MSGNQQPQICLPTWRCRDFNAAIPIKKRKYFVLPEEAPLETNTQANEQGDTRSALDSSVAHVKQKMIGVKPILSFPSVSVGKLADKPENTGNLVLDQVRVKVEEPSIPIHSSPLAGSEILSSSNIVGSSLEKLPVGAEQHPGVLVTSDETELNVEQTVLKTHDIVREACIKENLKGVCQTEASAGAGNVSLRLGFNPKNNSPYWENEEPSALNLSLNKGVCAPHVTDSISTCTKSGNHSGVNRINWDLNTTMDAWEDGLDRKTRVKTPGSFFNTNNRSCHDIDTSSMPVIAKPPTVTSTQFDCQVSPTDSPILGLSSYPPVEKSLCLPTTTSEARVTFSRPIMTAGNVNSVSLRTVKSEVIEESVQAFPIGLSINRVKQEVVGRFREENSITSGSLNPVDSISIKAEPNNFTQSEVFNRKDGTLNHPQRQIMQSNEILDLPTTFTRNQKDTYIPHPNGISNAPMSMNGMTRSPGFQSYTDSTLKENSDQSSGHGVVHMTNACSGHGDHNLNASDVNVSVTEDKILDDCKTYVSRRTDELSISGAEKVILSGKELREELYSYEFEPNCGNDLSRVLKKQVGTRNLLDDENVQRPAAIAEGKRQAECSGSETEQRDMEENSNHVEEKESQAAPLGNTGNENTKECSASSSIDKLKKCSIDESCLKLVEMANTKVQIKRLTPETQWNVCGSGDHEGRMVQDGEQSTHQIIHSSEGMSGVSTLSGRNVDNRQIVDNISPGSYKAELSTIDDDPPPEFSEGSQGRIKTLDASDSFEPLRMERDRLPDIPLDQRKYLSRWSDESCKFSRDRYHGKVMRGPRLNFMPDKRRFSDNTENNLQDRDTKNFESNNYGNTRRGGAFMSNSHRGRRFANDEVSTFPHSFTRRTHGFSFKQRGSTDKEDASACHGFRDGENFTRGVQSNDTEPMFMSQTRPYQGGRNSFARGRTNFSNNLKRGFSGFRSRSPVRSRERSAGPSSSFRNRSQEDFSGNTDFSHRRSSPYRMGRINSPEHSGYPREMAGRRPSPPPYSHRPTNAGRGRGYPRGRGYTRGRGYGRDGIPFRKPYDRVVHRNHGNLNNLEPRERVDYNDDFFEGPGHSERFGVDVRRQYGYKHDGTSSFTQSFNSDGCAPTNVENGPDAVRCGQNPDTETVEEQGILMETDGNNKNSTENASGRSKNMEEEETSKHNEIWQRNELDGDRF